MGLQETTAFALSSFLINLLGFLRNGRHKREPKKTFVHSEEYKDTTALNQQPEKFNVFIFSFSYVKLTEQE